MSMSSRRNLRWDQKNLILENISKERRKSILSHVVCTLRSLYDDIDAKPWYNAMFDTLIFDPQCSELGDSTQVYRNVRDMRTQPWYIAMFETLGLAPTTISRLDFSQPGSPAAGKRVTTTGLCYQIYNIFGCHDFWYDTDFLHFLRHLSFADPLHFCIVLPLGFSKAYFGYFLWSFCFVSSLECPHYSN